MLPDLTSCFGEYVNIERMDKTTKVNKTQTEIPVNQSPWRTYDTTIVNTVCKEFFFFIWLSLLDYVIIVQYKQLLK